jgi:DNA-binding transcriptional ArsR family regulator
MAVSNPSVFVTTFLASAVEVIEMVIIIVGVGTVRSWRSTWLGAGARAGRSREDARGAPRPLHEALALVTYNPMVVGGGIDGAMDRVFHALADATRRDILHRCIRGEPSVSRLADVYPMSFAAVQKHVAVLERAGLVTKERRGREQLVRTDGDAVGRARRVLDELEAAWRGRVDRMADLLAQLPEAEQDKLSMGHSR